MSDIIKELINLSATCLDFDYESLDEIVKDRQSFETFSKIKVDN